MMKIELYTADKQYVATVEVPPFLTRPGVLTWGARTFIPGENGTYVEAFAVASMTPSPGLARNDAERCTDALRDGDYMRRCVLVSSHSPSQHNYEIVTAENKNQLFVGPPPPVDRAAITTLRGTPVEKLREIHRNEPVGQHADYIVLTDEERAKGFVRPVRDSYKHVGAPGPKYPLRDLTAEEHERYDRYGYVKFEEYPESERPNSGRFWMQADVDRVGKGCGSVTSMGLKLAETYARDPHFYGSTFCTACNAHFPVGETGEFVWDGTDERVGT